MTRSTVSVIIPAFNRVSLIGRAVESVLSQTHSDFELIVVDDASTDGTQALLAQYARKDSRIRVLESAENRGAAAARNRGLSASVGEFVAFLDSDDAWRPHHLRTCLEVLAENRQIDAAFADIEKKDSTGASLVGRYLKDQKAILQYLAPGQAGTNWRRFAQPELDVLLRDFVVPLQTLTIRRSALAALRFDEKFCIAEDWDFVLQLCFARVRFAYIDDVHCDVYIHAANLCSNGSARVRDVPERCKMWIKTLEQNELTTAARNYVIRHLAELRIWEGYEKLAVADRAGARGAFWSSLCTRPSYKAVRGILVSSIIPPAVLRWRQSKYRLDKSPESASAGCPRITNALPPAGKRLSRSP